VSVTGERWTASPRVLLVALLGAAAVVYALPMAARPIWNQDEARAVLLADDALSRGLRLPSRVRDVPYLNKPPLYFWSVALGAWPESRVSDRRAAISSVAAALAALLGTFAIGRLMADPRAGLLAAAVLATGPGFFLLAWTVLPDMMFAAWLTWALYFLLRALGSDPPRGLHLVAFYACVAGALWTKGPPALMAVAAAAAAALAAGGVRRLWRLRLLAGLAAIALTALPWAIPYAQTPGYQSSQAVGIGSSLAWYVDRYRHLSSLPLGDGLFAFMPWTLWLIPAVAWWRAAPDRQRYRPLLAWMAVLLGLLALSVQQRERYLLPVYPAFAVVVALAVTSAESHARPIVRATAVVLAGLLATAIATAGWLALARLPPETPGGALVTGAPWQRALVLALAVAGPAVGLRALVAHRAPGRAAWWLAGAVGGILLIEASAYPARLAAEYPIRHFAARARPALDRAAPLVAHPDANLAFDVYLDRPITEVNTREAIAARLAAPAAGGVLLRDRDWQTWRDRAHASWCAIEAATLGSRTYVLLAPCSPSLTGRGQ